MSSPAPADPRSLRDAAESLLLVTAAIEAGLLHRLEREREPAELARECGFPERGVGICLRGLEAVGVLELGRHGYRLTSFGRSRFVDRSSPSYLGDELPLWRAGLRGWLFLEEVLRRGGSLPEDDSPDFLAKLYRAFDAKPPARVARVVDRALASGAPPGTRVLDVGGGSGVYAREFLARGCRVTLLDRPATVRHVRDAFGLGRFRDLELVGGDFRVALPEGPFDVVLLADVLHGLSPAAARSLLVRVAPLTPAGGVLAIVDLLRGRTRRAALFAVTLLVHGGEGDTYGEGDIAGWVEEAGFGDVHVEELDAGAALMTARRPAGSHRRSD